ncbi:tannase and feruloyl esterase [Aspergillus steynii IBT 23096]|uniref:Carboxylic ester hydrolase n=1 Tax=Aspergillus steynii IBT 23096 TaxID=1392250 RepID=A0A2I2FWW6_9EURO|nr:tannase and feruloyl esterase [Aspergillus steynii IBT 23096]PLB45129.1 tannase and feruloyl esterase [Aspergillus steynii IBT 23096]
MSPLNLLSIGLSISQALLSPVGGTPLCSSSTFKFPELKGAEVVSISANAVHNFTALSLKPSSPEPRSYTIDFCNTTVTYTHPGWNDTINVEVWLPLEHQNWNGRLEALGGGGYSAGFGSLVLTQAVAEGFVAVDTDGGHEPGPYAAQKPGDWVLTSPGNVNLHLLEDFGSRSLYDMTIIGKAITEAYFGRPPRYSYFGGCSGGGRQGLMIAQRYPDQYDGILSLAPAINIENLIPAGYWAQQVMKGLGVYPSPCEINAFTNAAIEACDMLDGVKDGIISAPDLCDFNPHSVVGQSIPCNETERRVFTEAGANVVEAAWAGPRNPAGNIGWFGLNKDASLTATYINTECSNGTCSAAPSELLSSWFPYFVAKDLEFEISNMTIAEFFAALQLSDREYDSMMAAASPDLSGFRDAGGKMISWHGLADETIPPNGSIAYYQQVLELDPSADEFYRLYEAPGVGHCVGGSGPFPRYALEELIAWVEQGVVPETLNASRADGTVRPLCPYPSQQIYEGGDASDTSSFACSSKRVEERGLIADDFRFFRPS